MAKKQIYHSYTDDKGILYMQCKLCGEYVPKVGEHAIAVKCTKCVSLTMSSKYPPAVKGYKPTGRPPGWHFMKEFVDKDGNVFHKGKEQLKLKGTLKPTKVKPPKKRTKRRTKDQILVAKYKEKQVLKKTALKKAVQKQKDFLNHNIDKG
jgi:hypothetical protein